MPNFIAVGRTVYDKGVTKNFQTKTKLPVYNSNHTAMVE